ncbi:hypothetical protein PG993_007453 [Apiospora rasikravindrae]|uniref:Uncharacterized protein n=1 Tax=Apiospora rasikravindrae TaxID=990691 RepID=A0ABR1SXJ7_9PEZI
MASRSLALPPPGWTFTSPDLVLNNDILNRYAKFLFRPNSCFISLSESHYDTIERCLIVLFGVLHRLARWMGNCDFWRDVTNTWLYGIAWENSNLERTKELVDIVLEARGIDCCFYESARGPAQTRLGRIIDAWAERTAGPRSDLAGSLGLLPNELKKDYARAQKQLTWDVQNKPLDVFSQLGFKQGML